MCFNKIINKLIQFKLDNQKIFANTLYFVNIKKPDANIIAGRAVRADRAHKYDSRRTTSRIIKANDTR